MFARARHRLADDIDLESEEVRARLLALAMPRTGGALPYERVELWLFPAGYDRAPITLLGTRPQPRAAIVRCEAWPRGAQTAAERDVVEVLVRWPEPAAGGAQVEVVDRREAPGRGSRKRAVLRQSADLRERLERLRQRLRGARLCWRADQTLALEFRADRALLALTDQLHRLDHLARTALAAWCEHASESDGASATTGSWVLEEPTDRLPDQWRWLPALCGRRATLVRSLERGHCPRCGTWSDVSGWRERRYDRRQEVAGDAGVVLHCARGHEVVRVALETA